MVLREHLLRVRLGNEDADVVAYAVGGITEEDVARLGRPSGAREDAAADPPESRAKRRRLSGGSADIPPTRALDASVSSVSASLRRSLSRSLLDNGATAAATARRRGRRRQRRRRRRRGAPKRAARSPIAAGRRSPRSPPRPRAQAERESRVAAARREASRGDACPAAELADAAAVSARASRRRRPPGRLWKRRRRRREEAREPRVVPRRFPRAEGGASSRGRPDGRVHASRARAERRVVPLRERRTRGETGNPEKRSRRHAREVRKFGEAVGATEPVTALPASAEARVSHTSDISQWDLEPRGDADRGPEDEDPTLSGVRRRRRRRDGV